MVLGKPDLDRFLFEEYKYSTADLGIYRILYATCMLILYLPQFLWIPSFPNSFFNPPFGITLFFSGFPSARFFYILNVCLTWALCALLVGYRTKLASVSLACLLLIGNSWGYSFGKISNDICLVLIPLVLQFTGWGDSFSLDARRTKPVHPSNNRWPLALLAVLIGFAMLTAAVAKASTGWLDVKSHAVLGHIQRQRFVEGQSTWVTAQISRVKSGGVWEFADYATVLLEGSFIFAAVRSRAFRI